MLQAGGEADLALEAVVAHAGGELGVQQLERDRPVVPQVLREVDGGHPTAPELPLERVAALQRFTEWRERIGHQPLVVAGTGERYAVW